MKKTILVSTLLSIILLIFACNESTTQGDKKSDKGIEKSEQLAEKEHVPIDLTTAEFKVNSYIENLDSEDFDPSKSKIYIFSDKLPDSLFLEQEISVSDMNTNQKADNKIPDDAVFAVNSWWADVGFVYYGQVDQNKLNVYKLDISVSDDDSEPATFELFKTYICYSDTIEVK